MICSGSHDLFHVTIDPPSQEYIHNPSLLLLATQSYAMHVAIHPSFRGFVDSSGVESLSRSSHQLEQLVSFFREKGLCVLSINPCYPVSD
jgi:hypothetical protein